LREKIIFPASVPPQKKISNFFANNYRKCFILAKKWNGFSKTGHLKNLIKFEKKNHFFGKCSTSKKISILLEWFFKNWALEIFYLIKFEKKNPFFDKCSTPNSSPTPKIGMVFQKFDS